MRRNRRKEVAPDQRRTNPEGVKEDNGDEEKKKK